MSEIKREIQEYNLEEMRRIGEWLPTNKPEKGARVRFILERKEYAVAQERPM